jgi:DNA-binding NtrC family response regulator
MMLKILIAEDCKDALGLIEEGLQIVCNKEGCKAEFSVLKEGQLLDNEHRKHGYDLIIIDQAYGFEIVKNIRKKDTVVGFIVITDKATVDSAIEAIRLNVNAYMVKPFTLSELAMEAQNAVASSLLKKKVHNIGEAAKLVLKRERRG